MKLPPLSQSLWWILWTDHLNEVDLALFYANGFPVAAVFSRVYTSNVSSFAQRLIIEDINEIDSGIYTCEAGPRRTSIVLSVYGKFFLFERCYLDIVGISVEWIWVSLCIKLAQWEHGERAFFWPSVVCCGSSRCYLHIHIIEMSMKYIFKSICWAGPSEISTALSMLGKLNTSNGYYLNFTQLSVK